MKTIQNFLRGFGPFSTLPLALAFEQIIGRGFGNIPQRLERCEKAQREYGEKLKERQDQKVAAQGDRKKAQKARRAIGLKNSKQVKTSHSFNPWVLFLALVLDYKKEGVLFCFKLHGLLIRKAAYLGARKVCLNEGLKDTHRCEDSASQAMVSMFGGFQAGSGLFKQDEPVELHQALRYSYAIGKNHAALSFKALKEKQSGAVLDFMAASEEETLLSLGKVETLVRDADLKVSPDAEYFLAEKLQGAKDKTIRKALFPTLGESQGNRNLAKVRQELKKTFDSITR